MGRRLFGEDWRFHLGEAREAAGPDYDDSGWRMSISRTITASNSRGIRRARAEPRTDSSRWGAAWYRKSFQLPAEDRGQKVLVEFEGVYMNAEVWLNGHTPESILPAFGLIGFNKKLYSAGVFSPESVNYTQDQGL